MLRKAVKYKDEFMDNDELEAYLRKHTLNGARQEAHDAWVALWRVIVQEVASLWLRILDTLGL